MMNDDLNFLRVNTVSDASPDHWSSQLYSEVIRHTLRRILPSHVFENKSEQIYSQKAKLARLRALMPFVATSEFNPIPFNLSFFLLCNYRPNAFKFFFEMVSRWLVPGKRLNVVVFFAADFRLPDLSDEVYTIVEVEVRLDNQKDIDAIQSNLPIIATEIRLGANSVYHAIRILEVKGLSIDEKTAMLQESITALLKKRPADFDFDIFSEMQHFLVTCSDAFKAVREHQHMSRIIGFHYLFRKGIRQALESHPEKRHIYIKFMKTRLHLPSGIKHVWGVLVAINLLSNSEVFEEKHLIKAIQTYIPSACMADESVFINRLRSDQVKMIYLEIEREDGLTLSSHEIKTLKQELLTDLKNRVERRVHPIFMPRNEEEVMRHIVTLSNQLRFVRDLPQFILTFDEQTTHSLSFTVILLRVLKADTAPLSELFMRAKTFLHYHFDRSKIVGYLRKRYPKEASVFHVEVEKSRYLREDHSLDLYKARHVVVVELARIIGEMRDYNGGMLSKQTELFDALKEALGGIATHNALLLENYFYSLTPVVMRTVLEPHPLKNLFLLLLDTLEDGFADKRGFAMKFQQEGDFLCTMIIANEPSFKESVSYVLDQLVIPSLQLTTFVLGVGDVHCFGALYRSDEKEKRLRFCQLLEKGMETWNTYAHTVT